MIINEDSVSSDTVATLLKKLVAKIRDLKALKTCFRTVIMICVCFQRQDHTEDQTGLRGLSHTKLKN